ncbi:MAG: transglutaminase family protein [Pseudomonadota bacterium]
MKLKVSHTTSYTYPKPRRRVLQSHRLVPSAFEGQSVVDWTVEVEGAVIGAEFTDGAGDLTRTASIKGPVEKVLVRVEGMVETRDLSGVLRGLRERVAPEAYLHSTRATRVDVALAELAESAKKAAGDGGTLAVAHALSDAVHRAIAYEIGATEATTTAAEALELGKGVCQDHAHALIAAAVSADIPARYVAGYLLASGESPDDGEEVVAGEAGHGWAELYIEGLGWVGFDPSNACCPDDRYIRLCSGYDANDGAPIRGLAMGSGEEELSVAVAVQAVQQ